MGEMAKINFVVTETELAKKMSNLKRTFKIRRTNNSKKTTGRGRLPEWPYHGIMMEIFHGDQSVVLGDHTVTESCPSPINLSAATFARYIEASS